MSFSSLAKVFPSETQELLCLIADIQVNIPSCSTSLLFYDHEIVKNRIMSILQLGDQMSDKFRATGYQPQPHSVILKQIHRYRFFLESLDAFVEDIPNHLRDIEVVVGLLQEELLKDL